MAYCDGETIEAQVRTGDERLRGKVTRRIKIDVGGFEFRVIPSMDDILGTEHPVIVVALIARHLSRGGRRPGDVIAALGEFSCVVCKIDLGGDGSRYRPGLAPMPHSRCDGDYVLISSENIERLAQ